MQELGPDNAVWDDGEWISWDEINQQIQYQEWRAKTPTPIYRWFQSSKTRSGILIIVDGVEHRDAIVP